MTTELTFKYEEILEEENLQLNDLPKEIRLSINALKPNYARYQKQPSDAMREALIQQDIAVSNSIYDWLDEQEAEQERLKAEQEEKAKAEAEAKKKAEEEEKKKAEEEAAAKAAAEEEAKKKAEEEAEAKKKEEPKYKFGTPEMVAAIKEKIDANGGHIMIPELRAIIKQEPEYPYQEVYNIKLHKPYMKPFYKIV